MSDSFQTLSEVIQIEDEDDDDDEDVQIVECNINTANVYRNLICQKISQEIELLQAMYKHTLPRKFPEFKELAKKLGFQFGDDVIQSAWQRIKKKTCSTQASFPSKTAPICHVRPTLSLDDISPVRENASLTSSQPKRRCLRGPSTSTPIAPSAVPVALLLNKSIHIEDSPRQRIAYSLQRPKSVQSAVIEIDMCDHNGRTVSANDTADKTVVSVPESRCSEIVADFFKASIDVNSLAKRNRDVLSLDLNNRDISKDSSQGLIEAQNRLSEGNRVTQEYFEKHETVSYPKRRDSIVGPASEMNITRDNCSKKSKRKPDVFNSSTGEQYLAKSGSRQNCKQLPSALSQSFTSSFVWEQHVSCDMETRVEISSQKRKSSSRQVGGDRLISKAHVGVKAKIVKTKQNTSSVKTKQNTSSVKSKQNTSSKSRKKLEMSEAELKEFKAEQKRLKNEEKLQFEMQQLQKVHDRLVDILIPKYHNKNLNKI